MDWNKAKTYSSGAGLVVAATIGAGIFALPEIFNRAGWVPTLFYVIFFSILISYSHFLYWRARDGEPRDPGLLGLAGRELGKNAKALAFLSIVGGLSLTIVVQLVLGGQFLALFLPMPNLTLPIFWLLASLPLLFGLKRFIVMENLGAALIAAIIVIIFFTSESPLAVFASVPIHPGGVFLPFGAILFALAGWTSIEPLMSFTKSRKFLEKPFKLLLLGTTFVALLYLLFVSGVFGSISLITSGTVSGAAGWPTWKLLALGALGLFAIFNSHQSITLELKNSLERDASWNPIAALCFVVFVPIFLVWAGLNNILQVMGIAGGIFLSFQYLFIVLIFRKKMKPTGFHNLASGFLLFVFLAGALYEIYYFIVK
ncbi:MAG: aromatic amino acid transport family protein [Candidatus Liptonbacteria bacterium]|nr:aromatic amino acid transport family protein [Candidatus Liptonbacteria bacterium]